MRRIYIILISTLSLFLTGCNFNLNNKGKIEELTENFSNIMKVTDGKSSNLSDYTKNEYYDNIVKLREKATPILEKIFNNSELKGIEKYLSVMPSQDISNYDIEKYNLKWGFKK